MKLLKKRTKTAARMTTAETSTKPQQYKQKKPQYNYSCQCSGRGETPHKLYATFEGEEVRIHGVCVDKFCSPRSFLTQDYMMAVTVVGKMWLRQEFS